MIIGFQIILGILYANLLEWLIHKYLLHVLGQNKKSFFSFHWHAHHHSVRMKNYNDPEYNKIFWKADTNRRLEVLGLFLLGIGHIWILFIFPWVYLGAIILLFSYYYAHKYSHKYPLWGKKWLPWHYDHHMGINQNKNWCVTFPFWDYILRTRVKYEYNEKGKVIKP